jgi:predicted NACHT family NTPase
MRTPAPPEVERALDESLRTTGDQLSLQPAPEKGQPEAFSLLTAPGAAVVILSQLVAQELAQLAFSLLTAPGAAVVILSQLLAQELEQLAFSEPTAPGAAEADLQQPSVPQQAAFSAASPQEPQQAAPSWL